MALLPAARLRVTTAAGVPINGGKLRLYNANTTTLSTVYSDAALSVPLTNPVVAASDGFLPQIFAVEGLVVDGDYMTAGDVIISGQSFVDAVFVGANTGVITRDFTNSRLRIAGSAGIVSIEAGDPTGDDVGGAMRLGGYAASQLDTLSLDAEATNTTGDTFTVNSKKLHGVVATAITTFGAVATVDIALPNSPTGTRGHEVELFDVIQPDATANLACRLSYDSGATYKSGATDYASRVTSTTNGVGGAAAGSAGVLTVLFHTPANKPARSLIRILTPDSGNYATLIMAHTQAYDNAGTPLPDVHYATVLGLGNYGRATHLRLYQTLGSFTSGSYVVRSLRGYGE